MMKLNIKKKYETISFDSERYILIFESFNLLVSSSFFEFMFKYPNLTFKGNVSIKVNGETHSMHSFIHWLNLLEILTDTVLLEHLGYLKILSEIKVLPFCTSLSPDITYFIGAGVDNLDSIYHYDINTETLSKISNSIEELFNSMIDYDDV